MTRPSSSSPIAGMKPLSSLIGTLGKPFAHLRTKWHSQIVRELRRQRYHLHAEGLISRRLLGADAVRKNLTRRFGLYDVTAFVAPRPGPAAKRPQEADRDLRRS